MPRSTMRDEYSRQPASRVQRSQFDLSESVKTTFDAGLLIPFWVQEALPGDVFRVRFNALIRMATSLYPLMDNLRCSVHFWACANRNLWDNWRKFCGERDDPSDSIDYTIPVVALNAVMTTGSLWDYFGLPHESQMTETGDFNVLPARMYNFTVNEHYRHQQLVDSLNCPKDDGPDPSANYTLQRRTKRPDYFTTLLPSPQRGDSVSLPLGTSAPIYTTDVAGTVVEVGNSGQTVTHPLDANLSTVDIGAALATTYPDDVNLFADLSNAASATINEMRTSIAIQQHLELDSRGGTRYPEVLWSQFGTEFKDVSYRPYFLGGGTVPINVSAVANQSGSSGDLGDLAGIGTGYTDDIGFSAAFDEHHYLMGILCVDADLTYQQGTHRLWKRSTRYDFFWPSFAFIGDQAVKREEIYTTGAASNDDIVLGYSPRYEEYRTGRAKVTGLFRSAATGTLDAWHSAENFGSAPVLGQTFIESNPPLDRNIAVPTEPHFILDGAVNCTAARPIPLNGIPGLTRL